MSSRRLPFAELHLHIEGTFEPATIFALAAQNGLSLPYSSESELAGRYQFSNLQSFLDLYYENMQVLRREEDFYELAMAYLRRARAANVRHAELFIDPQAHISRGIPVDRVLTGISRALDDAAANWDISGGIIACALRDRPVDDALRMLDAVLESEVEILGIGLDSAEVGHPPRLFKTVFDRAAQAGLHRVAHAGEEGPPEYVWEALDILDVERIDHGVRSLEDPRLVERLVADKVPLTVCPLSNVRLRVVKEVADLPIRQMLEAGLVVTINSDDPAYFGGYLDDNIDAITRSLHLTAEELRQLSVNSVTASFASDARKRELLKAAE